VAKYISWGKGDVQQALNYYYKNLEKGKIKKASKNKQSKPPVNKTIPETSSLIIKSQKVDDTK